VAKEVDFDDGTEASRNRHIIGDLFENDILLSVDQARDLLNGLKRGLLNDNRKQRQAIPTASSFWESLLIPYSFDSYSPSRKRSPASTLVFLSL
jgi:hypothetical protein